MNQRDDSFLIGADARAWGDAYNDGHRDGVNDERERMISHLQDMRDNSGSIE